MEPPDVGDGGVGGEEVDELGDAAVVVEDFLVGAGFARRAGQLALVADGELQARDQEGGLPGAGGQFVVGELGVRGEDLAVRPVADPGAGDAALGLAHDVQHGAVDERLRTSRPGPAWCPGP